MPARYRLQASLAERGIPTAVHYPKGLHHQPAMLDMIGPIAPLAATEAVAERVLSLPFYPSMSQEEVQQVAEAVNRCTEKEPAV